MTKDEALKLALEIACAKYGDVGGKDTDWGKWDATITAIKEALAQPAQPDSYAALREDIAKWNQRPWVELTDAEIQDCYKAAYKVVQGRRLEVTFARAVGVKLKQKNLIAAGSQAFYGFPTEPVSTPNAGGKCVTAGETAPTHTLNSTKTVAVATDTYWLPIDKDTPRSAKLQLLSIGGVAQYGTLGSDVSFYTHWSPLPKRRKE